MAHCSAADGPDVIVEDYGRNQHQVYRNTPNVRNQGSLCGSSDSEKFVKPGHSPFPSADNEFLSKHEARTAAVSSNFVSIFPFRQCPRNSEKCVSIVSGIAICWRH